MGWLGRLNIVLLLSLLEGIGVASSLWQFRGWLILVSRSQNLCETIPWTR